jgi:hypothetical protein
MSRATRVDELERRRPKGWRFLRSEEQRAAAAAEHRRRQAAELRAWAAEHLGQREPRATAAEGGEG